MGGLGGVTRAFARAVFVAGLAVAAMGAESSPGSAAGLPIVAPPVWRAGPDPVGIVGGWRADRVMLRQVAGPSGYRVEEWVRCRNGEFTVQACPSHDVVSAYEFSDRHGSRLVVNRGRWDEVQYLGRGGWLISGPRDAAVATSRATAPRRLRMRPDLVVQPEPDMIHAVCPSALWGSQRTSHPDGSRVCLVDETTWQLIPMAARSGKRAPSPPASR